MSLLSVADDVVVLAGRHETATVYDIRAGTVRGDLPGAYEAVRVTLSRTGRWAVVCDRKNVLRVYDIRTREFHSILYEHTDFVNLLAISEDGDLVASVIDEKELFVFDRASGDVKRRFRCPTITSFGGLAFFDKGRVLAFVHHPHYTRAERLLMDGHRDWFLRLYDWRKGDLPTRVVTPEKHGDEFGIAKYGKLNPRLASADGRKFLSADGGLGLLLFDLDKPNLPAEKPKD